MGPPQPNTTLINSSDHPLVCSDGFFYDQNDTGLCRPECAQFGRINTGLVVIERIAICIGLVASVALFILSVTLQRSTL